MNVFVFFVTFFLAAHLLTQSSSAQAMENSSAKKFFKKMLSAYKDDAKAPKLSEFKVREQVWLGECVSKYDFSGVEYHRYEAYMPVIRYKAAPDEEPNVQFAMIDVGGDPYSSPRHIEEPEDAIWYLRGDAGNRLSFAKYSKKENALVTTYDDEEKQFLRKGKFGGEKSFLYIAEGEGEEVDTVCYFNERVL